MLINRSKPKRLLLSGHRIVNMPNAAMTKRSQVIQKHPGRRPPQLRPITVQRRVHVRTVTRRIGAVTAKFRAIISGMVLCLLVAFGGQSVQAAAPRPVGGVTISPAFQDVSLQPTDAEKTFTFSVTNNTAEPVEFSLSLSDFGSLNETGGVLFVGQQKNTASYRYGLVSWATLEKDRIVVEPKATEKVPVTITNKESMAPGGHYGAIVVTPVQNDADPSKVTIRQQLTSLLFVKKIGGQVYRMNLQDISVGQHVFSTPKDLTLRFQNSGNVHVVPRGIVTVSDASGRPVKQGIVNDGSAIILPQTFRQVTVPLEGTNRAWLPGRYTLKVAYRYDGATSLQYKETSFYYLSGWAIVLFAVFLLILLLLLASRRLRRSIVRALRGLVSFSKKGLRKRKNFRA